MSRARARASAHRLRRWPWIARMPDDSARDGEARRRSTGIWLRVDGEGALRLGEPARSEAAADAHGRTAEPVQDWLGWQRSKVRSGRLLAEAGRPLPLAVGREARAGRVGCRRATAGRRRWRGQLPTRRWSCRRHRVVAPSPDPATRSTSGGAEPTDARLPTAAFNSRRSSRLVPSLASTCSSSDQLRQGPLCCPELLGSPPCGSSPMMPVSPVAGRAPSARQS